MDNLKANFAYGEAQDIKVIIFDILFNKDSVWPSNTQ